MMYEVLSWQFETYQAMEDGFGTCEAENGGVYQLSEEEVDEMLVAADLCAPESTRTTSNTLSSLVSSEVDQTSERFPDEATLLDDVQSGCESPNSPRVDRPAPCCHNQWDNLRAKRDTVALRCRVCQSQWKTHTLRQNKCPDFTNNNCPRGDACSMVHVFRFKVTSKKRKAAKGGKAPATGSPVTTSVVPTEKQL
eukprot:TRINITY_DN7146_c0_g1_i1.p3 TRINITY_DN7146_c0_g1~~TRINITY_DN7146_c0_g1_i1.p3  ORF type:complete len:195 (+),score=86.45 TRINITY_DN7146_c0_g1_i1:328-912(+)